MTSPTERAKYASPIHLGAFRDCDGPNGVTGAARAQWTLAECCGGAACQAKCIVRLNAVASCRQPVTQGSVSAREHGPALCECLIAFSE